MPVFCKHDILIDECPLCYPLPKAYQSADARFIHADGKQGQRGNEQ